MKVLNLKLKIEVSSQLNWREATVRSYSKREIYSISLIRVNSTFSQSHSQTLTSLTMTWSNKVSWLWIYWIETESEGCFDCTFSQVKGLRASDRTTETRKRFNLADYILDLKDGKLSNRDFVVNINKTD